MDVIVQDAFSKSALTDRIFFPSNDWYTSFQNSYYSSQAGSLKPIAVFVPHSVEELATAVQILERLNRKFSIKFAVRSGGHGISPGAANIDGGVTIDLRLFDQVIIKKAEEKVVVGTGATWSAVYSILSKEDITIPGGRVAGVGVGGLTLGGGVSFFSPRKGFVCDNVVEYEIVLADGSIQNITQQSHPDLWWALKGGGNNFGIVTKMVFQSFPSGLIWGGCYICDTSIALKHLKAVYDFARDCNDEYAQIVPVYGFRAGHGRTVHSMLTHTKPEEKPASLRPFLDLATPLHDTLRFASQADIINEQALLSGKTGPEQCYMTTTTFTLDLEMLLDTYHLWEATVPHIETVAGVCWALVVQSLPRATTSKSASLGGNALGLENAPTLIYVTLINFWDNAIDNERLISLSQDLIEHIEVKAKERGVYHSYKYLNYAWKDQDVFSGYGEQNKAKLQNIAKKYDPEGLFQTAMPGGFKLF